MKIKHIYWFAYYNLESPSVRYRGKYPLDFLKERYNVSSDFVIPGYKFSAILLFIRVYCTALFFRKRNSLIVIQRVHSSFIYSSLLKLLIFIRTADTYYDLDDADYLSYPSKTIYHFIEKCSGVFVGSHELAKNLSKFNDNIILNTSPTPDLNIRKSEKGNILTVGWIGDFDGGHKDEMINSFFPALLKLSFEIKLVMLGVGRKSDNDFALLTDYFKEYPHIKLDVPRDIDWNNETKIQKKILEFDVGIATLLNTELHLSKSAFKVKQYLNNGVPVLTTDLPENNFFIENGKNGFVCSSTEDFTRRMVEIKAMSKDDYMMLSNYARESSKKFNLSVYCETLLAGNKEVTIKRELAHSSL